MGNKWPPSGQQRFLKRLFFPFLQVVISRRYCSFVYYKFADSGFAQKYNLPGTCSLQNARVVLFNDDFAVEPTFTIIEKT